VVQNAAVELDARRLARGLHRTSTSITFIHLDAHKIGVNQVPGPGRPGIP